MSRPPGDPQHLSRLEGQHLAVPGTAEAAPPDRIAVDGEPVSGLQPELVRYQPAGDQIRVVSAHHTLFFGQARNSSTRSTCRPAVC
jgi:hypothetical protein